MSAPLLSVTALGAGYGGAPVLHEVSLALAPGQALALLGANGAGKSTLLKAVLGLVPAMSGRIVLDGIDVTRLAPERRVRLGLGYVPEGRRVFPGMTVRDNLEVASRADAAGRARDLEQVFTLFPQLRARSGVRAWQLSGGQQQMLAIGRALMGRPRLLLLDEPTLGLSPRLAAEVMTAVRAIVTGGTALLLAEQNLARTLAVADQLVLLRLGRVVRSGPARDFQRREAMSADLFGDPLAEEGGDG